MSCSFFRKLLCSHYWEDSPSVRFYSEFMDAPNPNGFGNMKLMICNKCGKTTMRRFDFIDVKYIEVNLDEL